MSTDRLAAIFARVSEAELKEQRTGKADVPTLRTQVDRCRAYAESQGIPVADDPSLIVTTVHSGTDLLWEGSDFMALVHRIAARRDVTDVICLNPDRFCRGGSDAARDQERLLEQAGVDLHLVQMPLPKGMRFRRTATTAAYEAAEYWLEGIKEASVRNRTDYAEAHNLVRGNKPPFGFQFVEDEQRLTKRNRPLVVGLVPDPDTGPVLLYMTQHVADGGSVGALKAWLEAQELPTPKGATVWSTATIRRILHNTTNYGGRTSFNLKRKRLPDAHLRPKERITEFKREPGARYTVAEGAVTPIPGLTHDLWKRAVDRLRENQTQGHFPLPDEQRAEQRGLLFGGRVRCGVCYGGMRLKRHNQYTDEWIYTCAHTGTEYEYPRTGSVSMLAREVDGAAWAEAVAGIRDPAFFEQLVAEGDAANGPAIRAAALRAELADTEAEARRIKKLMLRLADSDDPDDLRQLDDWDTDLKTNGQRRATLAKDLAVLDVAVAALEAQRASLHAFRAYAAQEAPTLEQKTPIERRRILLALRTRCFVFPGTHLNRLHIFFDLRRVPGALAAYHAAEEADWQADWQEQLRYAHAEEAASKLPAIEKIADRPPADMIDLRNLAGVTYITDDEQVGAIHAILREEAERGEATGEPDARSRS